MTTEDDRSERDTNNEEREAFLTAYALGQLSGDEHAAVEAVLAGPDAAAARQHVAEMSQIAATLVTGREPELPERSADLRRAVLAAVAQADGPVTPAVVPAKRGRGMRWVAEAGALAATAALLAVFFLPHLQQAREIARRDAGARGPSHGGGASAPTERWSEITQLRGKYQSIGSASSVDPFARRRGDSRDLGRVEHRSDQLVVDARALESNSEQYNRFIENRFLAPADHPLSTFSIDVDTASYANTRRFLMAGQRPPRDAVRIEEFVNYFRYADPAPTGNVPFSVNVEAAACPWRPSHRIVRIGLAGRDVARDQRPAGNLVFLVDVSGSMADSDKLPLVKQALLMLVDKLTENDRVAIVTYAGGTGLRLPSTSGDQKKKIRDTIEALSSGGSTHGSAGIALAYEQAAERFIEGRGRIA